MIKPTILMDMDGPLADFDGLIHKRAETYGWEFQCEQPCGKHRFLTDCVPPAHAHQMRNVINTTRWFREIPAVPGCILGMDELLDRGFDVWICTKPLEANVWCRDDKAAWVRANLGKHWEKRLIVAPNKALVHGDVLVDDAIKPEWIPQATWTPIVYRMPFNGDGTKHAVGSRWDWNDGVDRLVSLIPMEAFI